MTTHDKQSIGFILFVLGQILLTVGIFSIVFSYTRIIVSLGMIAFGAGFLGAGGPSMTSFMRTAFPLRVRISLFILSLTILASAYAMHSK